MPWNMQDLLSNASRNKRSKVLLTHGSMADFMARGLGWEDYCAARFVGNDAEQQRIRFLFIPRLRTRIYNTEGGE